MGPESGKITSDDPFRKRKKKAIVADETKIKIRNDWIYVFAAIDPENHEIVGFHVSKYRESMGILIFLKKCLKRCEGKPTLVTDGGSWYQWAARYLGLKHIVLRAGTETTSKDGSVL